MKVIETERLILRNWKDEDILKYAIINQDPKVIEFLRGPMTIEDAKEFIKSSKQHIAKSIPFPWAVELKETGELIGFIGLNVPAFKAYFTPCIEIGWRLASEHWGRGYATEGAKATLEYGFKELKLKEILSWTVPVNLRSIHVMEKIGMKYVPGGDFAHPMLPVEHRLSKHVLYKICNPTSYKG